MSVSQLNNVETIIDNITGAMTMIDLSNNETLTAVLEKLDPDAIGCTTDTERDVIKAYRLQVCAVMKENDEILATLTP